MSIILRIVADETTKTIDDLSNKNGIDFIASDNKKTISIEDFGSSIDIEIDVNAARIIGNWLIRDYIESKTICGDTTFECEDRKGDVCYCRKDCSLKLIKS